MRILVFGDSNTYGYDPRSYFGGRYPKQDRWVDILAEKTGWQIINCGENGREIPRRISELSQTEALLRRYRPDILAVMLGTNDLLQGASVADAASRMEAFLKYIRPGCWQILLMTPPPVKLGAWIQDPGLIAVFAELAMAYRKLAHEAEISFLDTTCWDVPLCYDGVHFSETGHRKFAEKLYALATENHFVERR